MTAYVVTLEPDRRLSKIISGLKGEVRVSAGDQLYLRDEPHITLYVCEIDAFGTVQPRLDGEVENIRASYGPLSVEVSGWLVFADDAVTRRDTLTCGIGGASLQHLRAIQDGVVAVLGGHRRKEPPRRYAAAWDTLGETERANIVRYGYPFIGENWKPHLTIASIDPEKFPQIWRTMKERCPLGSYGVQSLSVHRLDEETDGLSLIKRYPLK